MKINYAELYGVKPGELDFSGAMHRTIEKLKRDVVPHLDGFIKELQIYRKRL